MHPEFIPADCGGPRMARPIPCRLRALRNRLLGRLLPLGRGAVGLTAIMLAGVLTHGADLTGIGISIMIGALIWFIGWAIRFVVSG
jgi:hypothetical protein